MDKRRIDARVHLWVTAGAMIFIILIVVLGKYAVYPVGAISLLAVFGYLGHSTSVRSRQRNQQQANYYRPKN